MLHLRSVVRWSVVCVLALTLSGAPCWAGGSKKKKGDKTSNHEASKAYAKILKAKSEELEKEYDKDGDGRLSMLEQREHRKALSEWKREEGRKELKKLKSASKDKKKKK